MGQLYCNLSPDECRDQIRSLGHTINKSLNGDDVEGNPEHLKTGFVLMIFPFGSSKTIEPSLISNGANMKDVANALKEIAIDIEKSIYGSQYI